jgi:membrane protease YdiL (CAAX protease family)
VVPLLLRLAAGLLRHPWLLRIVAVVAVYALALLPLSYGSWQLLQAQEEHPEALFGDAAAYVAYLLVAWVAVAWGWSRFEGRPLEELGFRVGDRRFALDFVFGAVLGAASIVAIGLVEHGAGWSRFTPAEDLWATTPVPRLAYLPMAVLALLGVAVAEELVSRVYPLRQLFAALRSALSPSAAGLVAVLATSALFGLLHAVNPHASWTAVAQIAVAGLLLGVAYQVTGEVALPVGFHLTWNLTQAMSGMPVSGFDHFRYARLVDREVVGPAAITGGAFGPEAGLTGLIALTLGVFLVLLWARLTRGPLRTRLG